MSVSTSYIDGNLLEPFANFVKRLLNLFLFGVYVGNLPVLEKKVPNVKSYNIKFTIRYITEFY